jgi:diguanylate cyclase (GGDEF)-like protein
MMDIDDFKACNDKYGHLVGDVVLKEISRMIRESVREIDLVARYGGEEFSLILPETDRKGAILAAERIRKRIAQHVFSAYDEKLNVTVSAGLAVYPEDASDIERLIGKADAALYRAKNSGKNIICDSKG